MISGDRSLAEGKRGAFYNTLEEFHKYWERIDIISPKIRNQPAINNHRLFENVYIHPSSRSLWFQPRYIAEKGLELYKKTHFDLMTVHEYAPFYNGWGARMLFNKIRVPYVLELHHITGFPKSANLKEKLYLFLSKIFLKFDARKAVAVRIVNESLKNFLVHEAKIPTAKVVDISSMYIDLDIFKPTTVAKKYDLIFVGRLAANKGIDLFIKSVRISGTSAIIVGDGLERGRIEKLIEKYGLKDKINLIGWVKDSQAVADLINQSKILVMTSFNEGGPRVVLEAMACKVPVLATPVGIANDVIKKYKAGGIIDWNPTNIAKKIQQFLNDSPTYEICRNACLEAAKKFEKKEAIKNYAERLQVLIK